MNKKRLHIICLEIPSPPIKGSSIDAFHLIKALHQAGIEIILHCFYKEIQLPVSLTTYCKEIYLLPRKKIEQINNLYMPLYTQARRDHSIFKVLLKDQAPILFIGHHTLFHFDDPQLEKRQKFIRLLNIESNYYQSLTSWETSFWREWYYRIEATLSKKLEKSILPKANHLFAISNQEIKELTKQNVSITWIPPFVSQEIISEPGIGSYIVYHGDLSIKENENAVLFLLDKVIPFVQIPFKIAGQKPSKSLRNKIRSLPNAELIESPNLDEMESLLKAAQIILAPFSQTTGYKLKLVESLRCGRHVITSAEMKVFSELNGYLHFASEPSEWISMIKSLQINPIQPEDINRRKILWETIFNSEQNAKKMTDQIFK